MICFTAPRKGGRPISKDVLRGIGSHSGRRRRLTSARCSDSTARRGHDGQTDVPFCVNCAQSEKHVVLRDGQRNRRAARRNVHRMLPIRLIAIAPQYLISSSESARRGFPGERRVIGQTSRLDMHICRRSRRRRQRCQSCCIRARHVRDILEIDKLNQIAVLDTVLYSYVLMLMVEVLAIFGDANCSESLFVERSVIASAQKTIAAKDERGLKLRQVLLRDGSHISRELTRRRIVLQTKIAEAIQILRLERRRNAF